MLMLAKVNYYWSNNVTLGRFLIQSFENLLKSGKCLKMKKKISKKCNLLWLKLNWDKAPDKNLIVNFNTKTSEFSSKNTPTSSELSLA